LILSWRPDRTSVRSSWEKIAARGVDVSSKSWWQGIGIDSFGQTSATSTGSSAYSGFWLPHWLFVALFGSLAGVTRAFARRARMRLRASRGLCPVCGYDVRANPERRSECGTPLHRATAVSK
jgi:hypothetical protein